VITADIPTKSANKAFGKMAEKAALDDGFACKIEGSWNMGFKVLSLKGEIYSSTKTQASMEPQVTVMKEIYAEKPDR
jgi:hypothetical protein